MQYIVFPSSKPLPMATTATGFLEDCNAQVLKNPLPNNVAMLLVQFQLLPL